MQSSLHAVDPGPLWIHVLHHVRSLVAQHELQLAELQRLKAQASLHDWIVAVYSSGWQGTAWPKTDRHPRSGALSARPAQRLSFQRPLS